MARLAPLAVLVGLVVALLAGCNTTAIVRVDVKPNGSGSVTVDVSLDPEAAAKVGDLSKVVQFADLRKAGWKIEGPRAAQGQPKGTVTVSVSRPFANVDQANKILAEHQRARRAAARGEADAHVVVHLHQGLHGRHHRPEQGARCVR